MAKSNVRVMSPFLNVQEAAEYLRVKVSTVYAWIHQEKIPVRYHGRKPVFLIEDLRKWSDDLNQ